MRAKGRRIVKMGEQTVCRLPERRNDPLHVHRVEVYERFTS